MGMRPTLRRHIVILGLLSVASGAAAAESDEPMPIRDNSFLVEEAYNQERGVVQHISSFSRSQDNRDWLFTFTQEWPLTGLKHQVGFTFPFQDPGRDPGGDRGMGDLALNYRFQAAGGGAERAAFAPRLSLLLPTGEERDGRGTGAPGLQVNLPVSLEVTPFLVSHSNAGATRIRSARNELGDEADVTELQLGQSLIWLTTPRVNLILEAVWIRAEDVIGPGRTDRSSSFFVSPGIRGAIDLPSGLQIVPGLAFPTGAGGSRGENGVLLYLSFEHPYRPAAAPRD